MNYVIVNDVEWCTSASPPEDFRSVVRTIWDEFMQIALASVSLVFVLFSMVKVVARLAEYALDVAIKETVHATCPRPRTSAVISFCKRRSVRSAATAAAAMLLCWLYVSTVVGPVYSVIEPVWHALRLIGTVIVSVLTQI